MSDSEEDLSIPQMDSESDFDLDEGKSKKKSNKKTTKSKTNSSKSEKTPKKKKSEDNTKKKSSKKETKSKTDKSDLKKVKKDKKDTKNKKEKKEKKEKKTTRTRKPKEPKEKTVKLELNTSFSKLGQRYMTPPQGDGTRGFYESLYEENPNSLIAIKFCVEYGIFGGSKHDEVLHKYTQLQKNGHFKGAAGAIKPSAITFLQKLKTN